MLLVGRGSQLAVRNGMTGNKARLAHRTDYPGRESLFDLLVVAVRPDGRALSATGARSPAVVLKHRGRSLPIPARVVLQTLAPAAKRAGERSEWRGMLDAMRVHQSTDENLSSKISLKAISSSTRKSYNEKVIIRQMQEIWFAAAPVPSLRARTMNRQRKAFWQNPYPCVACEMHRSAASAAWEGGKRFAAACNVIPVGA